MGVVAPVSLFRRIIPGVPILRDKVHFSTGSGCSSTHLLRAACAVFSSDVVGNSLPSGNSTCMLCFSTTPSCSGKNNQLWASVRRVRNVKLDASIQEKDFA